MKKIYYIIPPSPLGQPFLQLCQYVLPSTPSRLNDQAATTVKPSLKPSCFKGDLNTVSPSSTTAGSPGRGLGT